MQRLNQTFASYGLPSLTQFTNVQAATDWLEHNSCAVCLLDYELPGIDGLRSLARLHQRQPGLPVIMLSNAGTEDVAIAAFRAGVRDYVPKKAEFAPTVALQVRQILRTESTGPLPEPIVVGPDVQTQLRLPTYQNRMRVIGREMDVQEYRSISLWEVGGGFLARGTRPGRRTPEALEFLDRDLPQLVAVTARGDGERRPRAGELQPTGYEDLLRAIGRRLDDDAAESVGFFELSKSVVVTGMKKVDGAAHTAPMPFEWVYDAVDVAVVLDEAFRRRSGGPVQQPGLLRRLTRT